jgi:hypothetical protein
MLPVYGSVGPDCAICEVARAAEGIAASQVADPTLRIEV